MTSSRSLIGHQNPPPLPPSPKEYIPLCFQVTRVEQHQGGWPLPPPPDSDLWIVLTWSLKIKEVFRIGLMDRSLVEP